VTSVGAPSASDIVSFLRRLRRYRAGLPGPGQVLLDSLVAAGLGPSPDQVRAHETGAFRDAYAVGRWSGRPSLGSAYDAGAVTWGTTPWGLAWEDRYGWPGQEGPACD